MFKPTQEQIEINEALQTSTNLIVEAGAGTGKSSTLRYLAQENPNEQFLVLCFGRANAQESNAHPDKPSNIIYSTVHALAYHRMVTTKEMRKKLKGYINYKDFNISKLNSIDLESISKDAKDLKDKKYKLTRAILDAINLYCRNDSTDIMEFAKNCYYHWFTHGYEQVQDEDVVLEKEAFVLSERDQLLLAKITKNHWLYIIDTGNEASISHDVYLKLFYLHGYRVKDIYDRENKQTITPTVICLDEAQDTNTLAYQIFVSSLGPKKVVVGDDMQQLYAWRGAGDTMLDFANFGAIRQQLSQSFRFGQDIADIANKVLRMSESTLQLVGSGTQTEANSLAILCRTNIDILRNVLEYKNTSKKVYVAADLSETFSKLYHLNSVAFNEYPKYPNKMLKDIKTHEDYVEAMRLSPDLANLDNLRKAIIDMAGSLHVGIQDIKNILVDLPEEADITISTIHKSKGLEFDTVKISEALISFTEKELATEETFKEAIFKWLNSRTNLCLLYVAVTRAKVKVILPSYLEAMLS